MKSNVRVAHLRRAIHVPLILLALLLLQALPASAAPSETFPSPMPLPDGFRPEGIAVGRGSAFFVGSIPTGSIYRGDLRTGEGEILVQHDDRAAIGLSLDERTNYLFAAGGGTGNAYVYDAATGATAGVFPLTAPGTFVNDVIVTRDAAYFTDSFRPYLYRLPLGPGGSLPDPASAEEIELTGDFTSGPGFNTNGIDATPNGKWLLIVNSTLGTLYRVAPDTGHATLIDLAGADVTAAMASCWTARRSMWCRTASTASPSYA
jgi:sugar lactone lactonase YvrE